MHCHMPQGSAFSFGRTSNGVIPNVMDTLFRRIAETDNVEYTVRVGFVEIHQVHRLLMLSQAQNYGDIRREHCRWSVHSALGSKAFGWPPAACRTAEGRPMPPSSACMQETIRDLLVTDASAQPTVHIREVAGGGVCLAGAREQEVGSHADMAAVLEQVGHSEWLQASGSNHRSGVDHAHRACLQCSRPSRNDAGMTLWRLMLCRAH